MKELLIHNIGLLATPLGKSAACGEKMAKGLQLKNAAIGIRDGFICYVGPESDAPLMEKRLNAEGRLVTPGLIDAHTHLAFGGWRQQELGKKLAGVPYLDILAEGGGILSTVRATRAASEEELFEKSKVIMEQMFAYGVTSLEAKSGYGLSLAQEEKQLRAISRLDDLGLADVYPTFLGAHALPEEYGNRREEYIAQICGEMLPALSGLARFCDVFCEEGVFTAGEARVILQTARQCGLGLKIHADEIKDVGGTRIAAELGAVSADHLAVTTLPSMEALARAGVVGVLLPLTAFYLDKGYGNARQMMSQGMAVAVASDFNPGSNPCSNLQLAMQIACFKYRLTPMEALCAVTLNAAAALSAAFMVGSIEEGKQADILLWDAEDLDYIFYRYGINLVHKVIKRGIVKESLQHG